MAQPLTVEVLQFHLSQLWGEKCIFTQKLGILFQ